MELTDIVQDFFQLSFADMLASDLNHLKFFQLSSSTSEACVSEIVPRYLGSWANWKDQVVHPMLSGRGSSCSVLGGQAAAGRKRRQVRYQGLVRVGWVSSLTASRQMAQFLFLFSSQWKIFQ